MAVEETEKGRKDGSSNDGLNSFSARVLAGIFMVLDFIYRDDLKYMPDYRYYISLIDS